MTEEEAKAFFVEIIAILRRQGLAWLANEIAGEASEGQASPKMLSVPLLEETISRPTRRKTEFTHDRLNDQRPYAPIADIQHLIRSPRRRGHGVSAARRG